MSCLKNSFVLLCLLILISDVAYPRCRSVSRDNFMNRFYPLNESGFTTGTEWLQVTNGRYEDREDPLSLSYLYFEIRDVVFGDLTGDGNEEAAVVAIYGSNSGSFFRTDTYIFSCVARRVRLIGILKQSRIAEDSNMAVQESARNSISIRNNTLFVTHGTEGSRPSPEFITTFQYRIIGGRLLPQGRPMRRRARP